MISLKGIIQQGQVVLQAPTDLPDGTEVAILPLQIAKSGTEDGPLEPAEIARLLALMDQVPPFELTDEERAARDADRQARKGWEKGQFDAHAEKLRSMWQ